MISGFVRSLSDALDGHIALMKDMVEVSQHEQAQLIAFQPSKLATSTEEKRVLMVQLEASEACVRGHLTSAGQAVGLQSVDEHTLRLVGDRLEGPDRDAVLGRASTLRSLSESLQELQAMSLVQAERGLRLVRAYATLLRSAGGAQELESSELYSSDGRARREAIPTTTVSRNA